MEAGRPGDVPRPVGGALGTVAVSVVCFFGSALFYGRPAGCRCPEESAATFIDSYWRRSSRQAPGFTATTMNIKGSYLPLVGRVSGQGARPDRHLSHGRGLRVARIAQLPRGRQEPDRGRPVAPSRAKGSRGAAAPALLRQKGFEAVNGGSWQRLKEFP